MAKLTFDDKTLLKAVKSGNKEKISLLFKSVYEKYYKLVFFCVSKYVEDNQIVEDIVNDTFLSFFNSASKVKSSVKYYLLNSAKNNAINYLRKKKPSYDLENLTIASSFSDEGVVFKQTVEKMQKILSKMEVDIVLLHAVEDFKFREIATFLKMKLPTVITIYNRAIAKLKNYMEKDYE